MTVQPDVSRNGADEWGLDTAKVTDYNLIELLRIGESDEDKTGEKTTVVNATYIQPTLIGTCHWLRRTEGIALTKIYRLATKHGLLLIKEDNRYAVLENASESWLNVMRSRYDADTNARLNIRRSLRPQDTVTSRASIQAYSWVHGALVELAYDAGLQLQDVTIFCLLVSLETIPLATGRYAPVIKEDIARFWRHITIQSSDLLRAL